MFLTSLQFADEAHIQTLMLVMFFVWIATVVAVVKVTLARGSVGLPTALVLTMTFVYGGCFVYAVPGYTHLRFDGNPYLIQAGFTELDVVRGTFASLVGMVGLFVGSLVSTRFMSRPTGGRQSLRSALGAANHRLLMYLGGLALLSYVLTAFNFRFPMSGALLEAGRNLALAVAMLGAYLAMRRGESIVKWYLVGALAPVYFLFVLGFMSLGFLFAMVMVGFYLGQLERPGVKSKSIKFLMIPMMFIGLMSGFTAWMSIRTAFRQVLWFGSEGSVVETIMEGVSNMSIFSIRDFEALDIVNIRLNLPLYIGRMIEHHELNPSLREFGSTLYTIPFAVVPRFLWPDKPTRGGNEFMSTHTGMTFSSETTFGFGSVFEYYVNFGYSGVFIGFLVFGILLSRVDQVAAIHLNAGRFLQFARLFMVGIVAVDPLQRPFFIVSGAAMAWIIVTLLIWVYEQRSVETGRA